MTSKFSLGILCASFVLASCGNSTTVDIDDNKILEVKKYNQVMQTGKELVDPTHGKQIAFSYGALSGVGEHRANGVSYLHTFEDGTSTLTVNLNILLAPKGSEYAAELKNPSTGKTLKAGTLDSILGDARHSVQMTTNENVSGFTQVVVRLGTTVVAEGTLKSVKK